MLEHKEGAANKTKLKMSLKESESKLSRAQLRVQKLEVTKDTFDQLPSKVDKTEKVMGASHEDLQYLEETFAEQFNQMLAENPNRRMNLSVFRNLRVRS